MLEKLHILALIGKKQISNTITWVLEQDLKKIKRGCILQFAASPMREDASFGIGVD